jgi:putative PIN family toxin of toxin-antitoxin system
LLRHLQAGAYTLLYSQPLVDELTDVLSRPSIRQRYRLRGADVTTILSLLAEYGRVVVPNQRLAVCRDPEDDKFLEVAVAGSADVIVSADNDLLTLSPFEGIPIVSAATFLAILESTPDR